MVPAETESRSESGDAPRPPRPTLPLIDLSVKPTPEPPPTGLTATFVRFFIKGLAALMPTLITLLVLVKVWGFLWEAVGQHIIVAIGWMWWTLSNNGLLPYKSAGQIGRLWNERDFKVQAIGVSLAILTIYVVGLFVGNIIGRTFWRLLEGGVMKIPLIKQIYPAVKQVTDLFFTEKDNHQFDGSRVVACQARHHGVWAVGLVTGNGLEPLSDAIGRDMVTVFIPSSPTAFAGYVVVVQRRDLVELPMSVDQLMRLLMTGGVVSPKFGPNDEARGPEQDAATTVEQVKLAQTKLSGDVELAAAAAGRANRGNSG